MASKPMLVLRLLPDDSALQLLVPQHSSGFSVRDLYAQLCAECERLGVTRPPPFSDVAAALEMSQPGQWLSVVAEFPSVPPIDGSVELLVDVPVMASGDSFRLHRLAVKAGTPLVRKHPGKPGIGRAGGPLSRGGGRMSSRRTDQFRKVQARRRGGGEVPVTAARRAAVAERAGAGATVSEGREAESSVRASRAS